MILLISALARRAVRNGYRRVLCLGIVFAILGPGVGGASASPTCDSISDPNSIVACALASSPELRSQEQEVHVLHGQRLRARSLLPTHPTVQVSFAGRRPLAVSADVQTTLNWYVTLSQEIEIAGQRGARVRAADAAISAQQRRVLVTAQEVASAALSTYYDALAATEAVALGREVAGLAEQLAVVGAARSQTALTSPLDAHVAQAEAARLAALRWEAERRVDELRRSLALQLGQPTLGALHGSLDTLPGTDRSPHQADHAEALVAQALALRGDLAAARLEQELRAARVQVLRRERVPNLTLSFMAQRDGFDEQVFGGGISLPLPLPAPLGPSRAGEIVAAEAQVAQAGLTVERLARQVRAEVLRAIERECSYVMQARMFPAELATKARADLAALGQAIAARQLAPRDALVAQRSLVEFLMGYVEVRRGLALSRIERLRAAGQSLALALVPQIEGGPR
ncbi:MAG: TolC family protein [Myxococcales bacterium]|nr:TolC family protein [Myxococcales bacterium]